MSYGGHMVTYGQVKKVSLPVGVGWKPGEGKRGPGLHALHTHNRIEIPSSCTSCILQTCLHLSKLVFIPHETWEGPGSGIILAPKNVVVSCFAALLGQSHKQAKSHGKDCETKTRLGAGMNGTSPIALLGLFAYHGPRG